MQLFYKKRGSGKPVVILHGLYGSSDNWISVANELADDYEVYLPDLRNHGRSFHSDLHNYESMRDDLLKFLDFHNLPKIILVGHSMGGKAAMCFARYYPERVEKLIVIDIAPKSYKELYRKEPLNHFDILMAMNNIDFNIVSTRRDVDEILAKSLPGKRIRSFLMKNLRHNEENGYHWGLNIEVLLRELDNIMDGINETCFDKNAPVKGVPSLFIRGENSPYVHDDDMNFITEIFPESSLTTVSNAGHWLHAENRSEFLEKFNSFLSGS